MKLLATMAKAAIVLFAVNFLAVIGLVLFLMSKGVLTREKVAAALQALEAPEGGGTPPDETGALTQPAPPDPPPISLSDRERAVAAVRADLDREIADIRRRQEMVERERRRLEADRADFEAQREAEALKTAAALEAARTAGLREAIKTYRALKAPRIKQLIAALSDEEMGLVLMGLDDRLRSRVIDEFKTPDETDRVRRVIQLIRDGVVARSGAAAEMR